jgi:hypothetical protein
MQSDEVAVKWMGLLKVVAPNDPIETVLVILEVLRISPARERGMMDRLDIIKDASRLRTVMTIQKQKRKCLNKPSIDLPWRCSPGGKLRRYTSQIKQRDKHFEKRKDQKERGKNLVLHWLMHQGRHWQFNLQQARRSTSKSEGRSYDHPALLLLGCVDVTAIVVTVIFLHTYW